MTQADIVDETVRDYEGHPERFSFTDSTKEGKEGKQVCTYIGPNGTHCAVGSKLNETTLDAIRASFGGSSTLNTDSVLGLTASLTGGSNVDTILKPEYKGMVLAFWTNLQNLHDDYMTLLPGYDGPSDGYWNIDATLTDEGREYVESLKVKQYEPSED